MQPGAATILPQPLWLALFSARMRQIFPTMDADDARGAALFTWPDAYDLEPIDAAEIYACIEGDTAGAARCGRLC